MHSDERDVETLAEQPETDSGVHQADGLAARQAERLSEQEASGDGESPCTATEPRPRLSAKYRRRALDVLERARLQEVCDRFLLEVRDRRANESYVSALIGARRLDFGEVLRLLKREELKAMCDALELDDSGRDKAAIVERILAGPPPRVAEEREQPAAPYKLTPLCKRAALGILPRDRLAELTAHFGLQVHDLRARNEHISAITRKRSLRFAEVLELCTREELEAMCGALDLEETARDKRTLIERIAGEPLADVETRVAVAEDAASAFRDAGRDEPPSPSPADARAEPAVSHEAGSPATRVEFPPVEPAAPREEANSATRVEFPLVARARAAGVLDGRGALIVAPTATGKSTIGRLLVQRALERDRGVLCAYLVPFRALAWELYEALHDELAALDASLRVKIATGDATDPVDPTQSDVIVATYESFAALHATYDLRPTVLVVDEIHMLADESRGPPLEMLLSHFRGSSVQLCGLSAVIDDPEPLAQWLGVQVVRGTVEDRAVPVECALQQASDLNAELETRALQAIEGGHSVLVFCHSKREAEAVARHLAEGAGRSLQRSERERLGRLKFFLDDEESEHGHEGLARLVSQGVAFHHAGLVRDVRRQIEDAYRDGALKVIASTPTLAAGVNLPAELVLLKDVHRNEMRRNYRRQVLLPASEVLNMLGRAGRPGQSTSGRGVVLVHDDIDAKERNAIDNALRRGTGDAVHSRMGERFDWVLRFALRETAERECTLGQLGDALKRTLWFSEEPDVVAFERPLQEDLMEDIPTFERADGLALVADSVSVQPDGVTARVQSGDHHYEVSIRLEAFDCNCPSRTRWHRQEVCKHLARAIHDLLFGPGVEQEARYRTMYACLDLFRKTLDLGTKLREALALLGHWRLVDQTGTGYRATPVGRVAAWSGLDLLLAVDAFRRVREVQGTPEPREIALWTVNDFFGDPSDREKWKAAVEAWLDEAPNGELPLPTKHRGDFQRTSGDLVRVTGLYAEVADAIGNGELAAAARTAGACLQHGVKPDALPLAALNIPELGRRRCRYLIGECGIRDVNDLADAIAWNIADRRVRLMPNVCEQWVKRARAIRDKQAAARSMPESEQRAELDDLFAQFRVEPIALEPL